MLDINYQLNQKAIFRIAKAPTCVDDLLELLQGVIYDYLRAAYAIEMEWPRFCGGGTFITEDQQKKLITVRRQEEGRHGEWALKLKFRDPMVRRRNWIMHIGIRMEDDRSASLYFAQLYSDHLAGSFAKFDAPYFCVPSLLTSLLCNQRFVCLMGTMPIPACAVELNENMINDFQQIIFDPKRHLPVVLISCPDLLNPDDAANFLLGNAAVFWSDDPVLFDQISETLFPAVDIRWDSIQVLLPILKQDMFHPSILATEFTRMGRQQAIHSLRQAYCASLRAEERREFVTADDIYNKRDRDAALALQEKLSQTLKELASTQNLNETLSKKLDSTRMEAERHASSDLQRDMETLEEMVTETSENYNRLKQNIDLLTSRLYACMGMDFSPDDAEEACISELERAISACFSRLRGKK